MKSTSIDHITITAPSLEAGTELLKKSLDFSPQKGGEHPKMGTHNLFLRLGDAVFLEVIACNPNAKKPERPRWFALDDIKKDSPAKLRTWVVRTENIHSTLENSSESLGEIEPISRGDTNWLITIPKDGSLALNGGAPALIEWQVAPHPATKLTDFGLSLHKLEIHHPEPERIIKLLSSISLKQEVDVIAANTTKIIAYINTPNGIRQLNA